MVENVDNLILEHLRHIRNRIDKLSEDSDEIKYRLTSLEKAVGGIRRDNAGMYEDSARQQHSLDQLAARIDRIERRLEINESS